ncbi:hypothetical protein QZH41_013627, partial [Actinostola sp. cb2023]
MSSSNYKSILNQYCQTFRLALPKYSTLPTVASKGTQHLFTCLVELENGQVYKSQGTFGNKKSAEQSAAELALRSLGSTTNSDQDNLPSSLDKSDSGEIPMLKGNNEDGRVSHELHSTTSCIMSPDSASSFTSPLSTPQTANVTTTPTLATSKSMLNEQAQKLHIALPVYETLKDNIDVGFTSVVTFNSVKYQSKGHFRLKKEAEKSAAFEALMTFQNQESLATPRAPTKQIPLSEGHSSLSLDYSDSFNQNHSFNASVSQQMPVSSPQAHSIMAVGISSSPYPSPLMTTVINRQSSTPVPQIVSYKNVLQEYMQQRRKGDNPQYETVTTDNGLFRSIISFCDKTLECSQGFSTKKEAEQCVAREALISLGIKDPEHLSTKEKRRRTTEYSVLLLLKSTFNIIVSRRNSQNPKSRKRQRLDDIYTSPKRLKLECSVVEKETGHIKFLSVGEIWKEKRNVALVGNEDTSFVLYCTRVDSSLVILNTRTMLNQVLEPGHRLIGLDAEIIEFQGKLALQAERCADVEIPQVPDPVLISCGVVTLYQDMQDSSHVEVLLKRYVVSQAFINVKAALAQFFRRAVNGHPVSLPVNSLTEHIGSWKLDEVVGVATMTIHSIKQVFSTLWKFKDQWEEVLESPLPNDLQDLQKRAQEELSHRNANGVNITDLENHPWSLPKGNFRHRMLSTGLHIEKPTECAARELNEETNIQLYPADLENIPYIDLAQDDNLNPHKGRQRNYFVIICIPNTRDVSRYFLYIYKPIVEELNSSVKQMIYSCDTSVEHDHEQSTTISDESGNIDSNNKGSEIAVQLEPSQHHPTDLQTPSFSSNKGSEIAVQLEPSQHHPTDLQTPSFSSNKGSEIAVQLEPSQHHPTDLQTPSFSCGDSNGSVRGSKAITSTDKAFDKPTLPILEDLCTSESSSSSSSSSSPVNKTSPLNTAISSTRDEQQEVELTDTKMNPNNATMSQSSSDGTETVATFAKPQSIHRITDDKRLHGSDLHVQGDNEHQEQRGIKRKRSISDEEEECN